MAESINIRTVRRIDSSVSRILDSAKQVQLYKFEEIWVKTEYAGALHVCERAATPFYTVVIVNRLNSKSWIEPISAKLEFQLQTPFLLYKTEKEIYGLWFYDKDECERLGDFVISLVNEEREGAGHKEKALNGAKAGGRSKGRGKPEILRFLVHANNDYLASKYQDDDYYEEDDDADVDDDEDFEDGHAGDDLVLFKPMPMKAGLPAGARRASDLESSSDGLSVVGGAGAGGGAGGGPVQAQAQVQAQGHGQGRGQALVHAQAQGQGQGQQSVANQNILKKLFANATVELPDPAIKVVTTTVTAASKTTERCVVNNRDRSNVCEDFFSGRLASGESAPKAKRKESGEAGATGRNLDVDVLLKFDLGGQNQLKKEKEEENQGQGQGLKAALNLMTPAMFAGTGTGTGTSDVSQEWRPNNSSSSATSPAGSVRHSDVLFQDVSDQPFLNDLTPRPNSNPRASVGTQRNDLDSMDEFKEALIHVIRHNDVFVREIMQVMKERRAQRGDFNPIRMPDTFLGNPL